MEDPCQNQGRGSSEVEFLGSGDCFDAPSHIPYVFIVGMENEIHSYCKHMLTTYISNELRARPGSAYDSMSSSMYELNIYY